MSEVLTRCHDQLQLRTSPSPSTRGSRIAVADDAGLKMMEGYYNLLLIAWDCSVKLVLGVLDDVSDV